MPRISWAARADGIRYGGRSESTTLRGAEETFWDLPGQRGQHVRATVDGSPQTWSLVPLEWSLPILGFTREWEPREARSAIERPLHVAARPTRLEGSPPDTFVPHEDSPGAYCELWVRHGRPPDGLRGNCRITLACDGALVLGEGEQGWATCSRDEEGFPAAARIDAQDGVRVDFHWTRRQLRLAASEWSAEFELVNHPECSSPRRVYHTVPLGVGGPSDVRALSLEEGQAQLTLLAGRVETSERVVQECVSGRVRAEFGELGTYYLEYGWGFEALAGYRHEGERYTPWAGSLAREED